VSGNDFLVDEPAFAYDCIITNPPYSIKDRFLTRCYELKKPFALLMPLTALEGKYRQQLYPQLRRPSPLAAEACSLPKAVYGRQDELLFCRSWVYVAHTA